jgi:GNAT superfamily N-acetyltransferase
MVGMDKQPRLIIRRYHASDARETMQLFRETIRSVNLADYSQKQVMAWAPEDMDPVVWNSRLMSEYTLVAFLDSGIAGFGSLTDAGCIDMLYVHKAHQGERVGSLILQELEKVARRMGLRRITTEASITARPFFECHGFTCVAMQEKPLRGQVFVNYIMQKVLAAESS